MIVYIAFFTLLNVLTLKVPCKEILVKPLPAFLPLTPDKIGFPLSCTIQDQTDIQINLNLKECMSGEL